MMPNEQDRLIQVLYVRISELESKLAASEEARKESHEAFEIVKKQHLLAMRKMIEWKQRAEAAEKLIEDSKKQAPVGWECYWDDFGCRNHIELSRTHPLSTNFDVRLGDGVPQPTSFKPVYLEVPIPPELSEVVRERDELRRKLEEFQSGEAVWLIDRQAFIKTMVDKFLSWKIPENFNPDAGISFEPEYNKEYMAKQGKPPMRHEPIGTNLFDAEQAKKMFEDCFPYSIEMPVKPKFAK